MNNEQIAELIAALNAIASSITDLADAMPRMPLNSDGAIKVHCENYVHND